MWQSLPTFNNEANRSPDLPAREMTPSTAAHSYFSLPL